MSEDRRGAVADWQALRPEQRQLAWRAAGGTAVIEDPDLALVIARYAAAMRTQTPTRYLVAGLVVLVVLLGVAVTLIAGGQTGAGIVLAAIGVLGAGIGMGAIQVRQAGFDRLYIASAAVLGAGSDPEPADAGRPDDDPGDIDAGDIDAGDPDLSDAAPADIEEARAGGDDDGAGSPEGHAGGVSAESSGSTGYPEPPPEPRQGNMY